MQRYRGRNRGGGSGSGSRRGGNAPHANRLKGLFADNIWHCNCTPRLPAEHFKVKKEGKNQGRWFYTCQQPEPKRCDFFLWAEDAKPREAAAVLNNGRSEATAPSLPEISDLPLPNDPARCLQEGWTAGRSAMPHGKGMFAGARQPASPQDRSSTSSPTPPTPISARKDRPIGGTKRSARDAGLGDVDDNDDIFARLTGQEEEALLQAANMTSNFETPQKAQKTGVYATPATTGRKSPRKLPWLEPPASLAAAVAPTTPSTSHRPLHEYFTTPSKPPHSAAIQASSSDGSTTEPLGFHTPHAPPPLAARTAPDSPSPPSRYKDALSNPADSESSLTSEVLAETASLRLPAEQLTRLRRILSKHDLRTQGVVKGRDISRLALKAKDAKIAELEARIASLEAERERDRGVIGKLRWDREHGRQHVVGGDEEEDSQL